MGASVGLEIKPNYTQRPDVVQNSYPFEVGEVGVVDLRYPRGHSRRYNIPNTGVADAAAALANAAASTDSLQLRPGTYRISTDLVLTSAIEFARGAVLKIDAGKTVRFEAGLIAGPWQIFDVSLGGSIEIDYKVPELDPRWWGATCRGAVDDAPAINSAIATASAASEGARVKLPPGRFRLSSSLAISTPKVSIIGSGRARTTLLPDAGVDGLTITCPITGGKYYGDSLIGFFTISGGRRGLYITDPTQGAVPGSAVGGSWGLLRTKFEQLACRDQTAEGIFADVWEVLETTFDHVWTDGGTYGVHLHTIGNIIEFRSCQFRRAQNAGCWLHGSDGASANQISAVVMNNPLFESNYGIGLLLSDVRGLEINGGWWENNGRTLVGGPFPNVGVEASAGAMTRDLTFRHCQLAPTAGTNDGLYSLQVLSTGVVGPIEFDKCVFAGGAGTGVVALGAFAVVPALQVNGYQPTVTGNAPVYVKRRAGDALAATDAAIEGGSDGSRRGVYGRSCYNAAGRFEHTGSGFAENEPTLQVIRSQTGAGNATKNLLQIEDGATSAGGVSGKLISAGTGLSSGGAYAEKFGVDRNGDVLHYAGMSHKTANAGASFVANGNHHHIFVTAASGAVTVTLPAAAANTGREYLIKKYDATANAVTIQANGAETIDGANSVALAAQYAYRRIVSDGARWHVVGQS